MLTSLIFVQFLPDNGKALFSSIFRQFQQSIALSTHIIYFVSSHSWNSSQLSPLQKTQTENIKFLQNFSTSKNIKTIYGFNMENSYFNNLTRSEISQMSVKIIQRVLAYGFQGIDVDIQYPQSLQQVKNLQFLLTQLRNKLPSQYGLSVDVGIDGWMKSPCGHLTQEFIRSNIVSWIGLMSYGAGSFNTLKFAQKMVNLYLKKGASPQKLVVGIGYFAKITYQQKIYNPCYNSIINKVKEGDLQTDTVQSPDPANPFQFVSVQDAKNYMTYIKSQKLLGAMVWHAKCDTSDSRSLSKAIYDEISTNSDYLYLKQQSFT